VKFDLRLYAILDPQQRGGHDLIDLARAIVAGGATMIQLRDKHNGLAQIVSEARAIKAAIGTVPLIINDHPEVAIEAGADGVHVGPDDASVEAARAALGPDKIIGHSIKTVEQARTAALDLIDYAGIGGVYATSSKDNPNPPIGVDGLGRVASVLRARRSGFPVCGIAGISRENAAAVIGGGADGVAVISALSAVADPRLAAQVLRAEIDKALLARRR
jgi:thiamine-phosphate pyrophosphorylase